MAPSPRRAVEPLGELDDQAFGSADVAEQERVLEVDDLPDRLPAGLRDALETDDPIDPLAAEHPGLAAVEAEQRKKPDCLVEVLDDKTDVDEGGDAGAMAVHCGQTGRSRSRLPEW